MTAAEMDTEIQTMIRSSNPDSHGDKDNRVILKPQLTGDELQLLKKVVSKIADRDFASLPTVPGVSCNEETASRIAATMDDFGASAYAKPDNKFEQRISVVPFADERGFSVEVELLSDGAAGDSNDHIVLVLEVLRADPGRKIWISYAYY